jgi:putative oxidoreductase
MMFNKLIHTDDDIQSLILRIMLGVVFFPHGAQKLLGWFGGHGFSGTMGFFTDTMGIPAIFAFLAIMAESLGAVALIAGFLTRLAALGIGSVMTVAVFMVHLPYGFFMNWFGNQKGEGFEYHLLAIAIALALIVKGGGKWSVDKLLTKSS